MPDEVQVQKNKFTLLSELLHKLCTSRNIKTNFKNLTSLILLFLNMYKKNYPIDDSLNLSITNANPTTDTCLVTIKYLDNFE